MMLRWISLVPAEIVYCRAASTRLNHRGASGTMTQRSEEHTSELQSQSNLVCRLLLEKKKHIRRHKLTSNTNVSNKRMLDRLPNSTLQTYISLKLLMTHQTQCSYLYVKLCMMIHRDMT